MSKRFLVLALVLVLLVAGVSTYATILTTAGSPDTFTCPWRYASAQCFNRPSFASSLKCERATTTSIFASAAGSFVGGAIDRSLCGLIERLYFITCHDGRIHQYVLEAFNGTLALPFVDLLGCAIEIAVALGVSPPAIAKEVDERWTFSGTSAFIGFTTKKKIAAAVETNVIAAVMNEP